MRQIPYTCVKLVAYDTVSSRFQDLDFNQDFFKTGVLMKKSDPNNSEINSKHYNSINKIMKHLVGGIIAGLMAAVISQPADVVLSKVCGRNPALNSCLTVGTPIELIGLGRTIV